jgi:short subunit dehydrogenase-like uncharacterized protein
MAERADREFDLVLFGATGFAGRLTADYLARAAPPGCRWAIAGRNRAKLQEVRAHLAEQHAALADLPVLVADSEDAASVRAVAERTRVVITTVGPYVLYGENVVAECAAAGTDYVDLTGEPEFVNTTYLRHHATAQQSGARLVHCCGFDSIPHDIGAYFTVLHLPEDVPLHVDGIVRSSAAISGGTLHSALTAASRPRANMQAARQRRAAEPRPADRVAKAVAGRPHRDPSGDGWVFPLPTIDPQIVARSARAVPRYGPQFSYSHYLHVRNPLLGAAGFAGIGAVATLAQLPPVRSALLARLSPGDGPSEAKRARSWFTVTFHGSGGGKQVITRVSGADPGYDETAKMLAESALALAFDDLPPTAGQVTPAAAMGDALITRLGRAGITFEVLAG